MFSGKTESLIARAIRHQLANRSVVIYKPAIDDRDSVSEIVSRAGGRLEAIAVANSDAVRCSPEWRSADVVCFDEVQFLDDGIVPLCIELADRGLVVICGGLDTDFRREPFGPIPELLSRADFVDKVQAVCHRCGGPATLTQRLINGEPAPRSQEQRSSLAARMRTRLAAAIVTRSGSISGSPPSSLQSLADPASRAG